MLDENREHREFQQDSRPPEQQERTTLTVLERTETLSEGVGPSASVVFGLSALPKPESTEGRPWGQSLKKPEGAPLNLG